MKLSEKNCISCKGGVPPLHENESQKLLIQLKDWKIEKNLKLIKEFKFKNFKEAIDFANAITIIAEKEGHHPDLHISYGKVVVYIWTHKINGLTESDFILASKIDLL